jgi:RNA-directed DNA polymerase
LKPFKNLYPYICSFEALYQAYRLARRGKRDRPDIADFELNFETNLLCLQEELQTQTYQPGGYHIFYIFEPKRRLVRAAQFRDRVMHQVLCKVFEPIWESRFIDQSYACRVGKGTFFL